MLVPNSWRIFYTFFFCRHKCSACYKLYNKKEHLVEHMKVSYHSAHEPRCGVCQKHCRSFESLREHLTGELLVHMRSDSDYCVFVLIHLLICLTRILFPFFFFFLKMKIPVSFRSIAKCKLFKDFLWTRLWSLLQSSW